MYKGEEGKVILLGLINVENSVEEEGWRAGLVNDNQRI